MATSRKRKPSAKAAGKATRKAPAKSRVARSSAAKPVRAAKAAKKASVRKTSKRAPVKTSARSTRVAETATPPAKPAMPRPASVKSAARAVAAARAGAAKRRPPSYIPRSRFNDDWMLGGPVELPRQPNPAAHAPTRKPPKPRAPKPKAISHEQAVANLKALLESRKRKDRGGSAGASAGKGA